MKKSFTRSSLMNQFPSIQSKNSSTNNSPDIPQDNQKKQFLSQT